MTDVENGDVSDGDTSEPEDDGASENKRMSQTQLMEMLSGQFQTALKTEERYNELKNKYDRLRKMKEKTDKDLAALRVEHAALDQEKVRVNLSFPMD